MNMTMSLEFEILMSLHLSLEVSFASSYTLIELKINGPVSLPF